MLQELERIQDNVLHLREPGYYWVRRLGESDVHIGLWVGRGWHLAGQAHLYTDDHIASVSHRIKPPLFDESVSWPRRSLSD